MFKTGHPFHLPLTVATLLAAGLLASCDPGRAPDGASAAADRLHTEMVRLRAEAETSRADLTPRARTLATTARRLADPSVESFGSVTLAFTHMKAGRRDSSRMLLDRVLELARADGDRLTLIDALAIKGWAHYEADSLDAAIAAFEEALAHAQTLEDSSAIASLKMKLANANGEAGDFRQAISFNLEAAVIYQQMGKLRELAILYGNLGTEYGRVRNEARSQEYLRKAASINERLGNDRFLADNLANLGASYAEMNMVDEATSAFTRSLELARRLGDDELVAQNLHNLGELRMRQNQDVESERLFLESLALSQRLESTEGIILNIRSLAQILIRRHRAAAAVARLEEALTIAKKAGLAHHVVDINSELSALFASLGDKRRAFDYLSAWAEGHTRIYGNDAEEALDHLEVEHALQQKMRENEHLRFDNEIAALTVTRQRTNEVLGGIILALLALSLVLVLRSRRSKVRALHDIGEQKRRAETASAELEESNSLKEMLLDVMSHDMLNPIAAIRSAADVLEMRPDHPRMIGIIQNACTRVGSLIANASTLNRVMVDGNVPKHALPLAELLREVEEQYSEQLAANRMALEMHVDEHMTVCANPILVEVFRNFMENAIRHSAAGGVLVIDAKADGNGVRISFADRGDTIPEELREVIFTRRHKMGPQMSLGSGLGLAIVKRIMQAHGGRVWVEANAPSGNVFSIYLPDDR